MIHIIIGFLILAIIAISIYFVREINKIKKELDEVRKNTEILYFSKKDNKEFSVIRDTSPFSKFRLFT